MTTSKKPCPKCGNYEWMHGQKYSDGEVAWWASPQKPIVDSSKVELAKLQKSMATGGWVFFDQCEKCKAIIAVDVR